MVLKLFAYRLDESHLLIHKWYLSTLIIHDFELSVNKVHALALFLERLIVAKNATDEKTTSINPIFTLQI